MMSLQPPAASQGPLAAASAVPGRRALARARLPVAACGSGGGAVDHPTGKTDVVLQVSAGGGFVPVEYNLTQIPGFTLYGDGTVIVTGPMIEIYPQPALPNLQTTTISEEAMQEILSAAKEAGLFANDVDYGQPGITDMPTTTITINADGKTYVSNIYALGMEQGAARPDHGAAAGPGRRSLEFDRQAVRPDRLPEPARLKWEAVRLHRAGRLQPARRPQHRSGRRPTCSPTSLDWPLGDLSTLGEAVQPEGYRKARGLGRRPGHAAASARRRPPR